MARGGGGGGVVGGGGKPFSPHQSTGAESHRTHGFFYFFFTENGDSETDEISLLSAQSAHLSAARVCHSASL